MSIAGSGADVATQPNGIVLSVRGLSVRYATDAAPVRAVQDVSFDLARGEVLGIAGESGCGKSTLAYAISKLLRPPGEVVAGTVLFHTSAPDTPVDVLNLAGEELRQFRWQKMAMVFQGAMNVLNPVLPVGRQLADVLADHLPAMSRARRRERCRELLDLVRIDPHRLSAYPHELSGGMRQRVVIAMALALQPDIIVMDEPTTALDVVVQRDILNEIQRLRQLFGFAVVFITHDLSLLLEISDRVVIMYGGRIVEHGPAGRMLRNPYHPYTAGLVASSPSLHGERRSMRGIPGAPPDLRRPIAGCSFQPRCPYAFDQCRTTLPVLSGDGLPAPGRHDGAGPEAVACLHYDRALRPAGPPPALREGRLEPTAPPEVTR